MIEVNLDKHAVYTRTVVPTDVIIRLYKFFFIIAYLFELLLLKVHIQLIYRQIQLLPCHLGTIAYLYAIYQAQLLYLIYSSNLRIS